MSVPMQRYPIFDVASPLRDLVFYEVVDYNIKLNRDMEYGTPHHNGHAYPNHKLVYITPNDKEGKTYRFYYAAARENQDEYNYTTGYESVGGILLKTVVRTYVSLRETHVPFNPAIGSAMPLVPADKFVSGFVLHKVAQVKATDELDSIFVFEQYTYIKPDTAEGKEYGKIVTVNTSTQALVVSGASPTTGINVIESTVTPLGNGQSVINTQSVNGGWPSIVEHVKTVQKENLTPQKFRNFVTVERQTSKLGTMPSSITLTGDEVNIEVKKETPDRYDKAVTTESLNTNVAALTGKQVFFQFGGGIATSSEALVVDGTAPEYGFRVLSSSVTPLGNGKSIKEFVRNDALVYPTLSGQKYDSNLDISIPYTRQVVSSSDAMASGSEYEPIDQWKKQKETTDVAAVQDALSDIHIIFPTQQAVKLPDVLKSIKVLVTRVLANGDGFSTGETSSGSTDSSVSVSADLSWEIEEGFSGAVPAEIHTFFLPQDNVNATTIAATVGANAWPLYRPKSHRVVISGYGAVKGLNWSNNSGGVSGSETSNITAFTNVAVIPATIHGTMGIEKIYNDFTADTTYIDQFRDQLINDFTSRIESIQAQIESGFYNGYRVDDSQQAFLLSRVSNMLDVVDFSGDFELVDFEVKVEPATLPATNPVSLTGGKYVFNSEISVYGFGMVRVTATVVDITSVV